METYHAGEPIVHPNYGAGVISEIQTLSINGGPRSYAVIDLDRGNHLLIPMDRLEEIGVRPTESTFARVDQAFAKTPRALSTNPKIRQEHVRKRIYSGNPINLAEVLRDLAWHARQQRLSAKDTTYQTRARQMLGSELAIKHEVELEEALTQIDTMLAKAIEERGKIDDAAAAANAAAEVEVEAEDDEDMDLDLDMDEEADVPTDEPQD